jgi:hypothetical protein
MCGVARSGQHLEAASAEIEPLPSVEDHDALPRHRRHFAPEALHLASVQPRGAGEELRRIDEVRGARPMNVHREPGVETSQRAGGAGVVEVNMREQESGELFDRSAVRGQPRPKRLEARRRTRIDEVAASAGGHEARQDRFGPSEVMEVDYLVGRVHR